MIDDGQGNQRPSDAETRCCRSVVVTWLNCFFLGEVRGDNIWVGCGGAGSMVRLSSLLFSFLFGAVICISIFMPSSVTNQGKVCVKKTT